MVWEIVLCLIWASYSNSLKVDRANEGLDTVPKDMDTSVTYLILDKNNLTTLDSNSFDIYISLTRLSVRFCETTYILDGTFDKQYQLAIISLDRCKIIQLPQSFGPSTATLEEFSIFYGYGSASVFKYPYFASFVKLTRLVFGRKPLELFDARIVPRNMERLRLGFSKLITFPDFRNHTKLLILGTECNAFSAIPQAHINTLSALTQFKADRNNLQWFPNISHMKYLRLLNISYNYIPALPREHISGLASIQCLAASNNLVENMPNISYLSMLELADFSNNLIRNVPATCLCGLPMIRSLHLNGNMIIIMDDNSVATSELYLHDNQLSSLPDLYDMMTGSLKLQGNPLVCDQYLCWLRMWPFNKTMLSLDNFYCASPPSLNGSLVMDIHPTVLGCYKGRSCEYNVAIYVSNTTPKS